MNGKEELLEDTARKQLEEGLVFPKLEKNFPTGRKWEFMLKILRMRS